LPGPGLYRPPDVRLGKPFDLADLLSIVDAALA
jgi:hypothetical protein